MNVEPVLSALFSAIVDWAIYSKGAEDVGKSGSIWIEHTEPNKFFNASVKVEMNATTATIDDVPPFTARLTNDVYFPGIMGLVHPYGGTLVGAGEGDEDRLIRHFESQPRPSSTPSPEAEEA